MNWRHFLGIEPPRPRTAELLAEIEHKNTVIAELRRQLRASITESGRQIEGLRARIRGLERRVENCENARAKPAYVERRKV